MKIEEIRKQNFSKIAEELGVDATATRMGCQDSYVRQLKSGYRNISSKKARSIEELFGKQKYFLDKSYLSEQDKKNQLKNIDLDVLGDFLRELEESGDNKGLSHVQAMEKAVELYKSSPSAASLQLITETIGSAQAPTSLLPISTSPPMLSASGIKEHIAKELGAYRAKYKSEANEPRIPDGSTVSIDPTAKASQGEMQAFIVDNELIIGRYIDLSDGPSLMFTNADFGMLELNSNAIDAGRVTHYTRTQKVS